MMEKKEGLATVIRADGTVPFDDDVSEGHRALHLAHLVQSGHHVEPHRHHKGHFFIKNWKKPA
jgi:hypothetical protein